MHPTLLESNRSRLHPAECTLASLLAHAALLALVASVTSGSARLPADEREAQVFFLLPPDRVDVRARQTDIIHLGTLGGDLEDGSELTRPGEGHRVQVQAYGARAWGKRSGAKGRVPFGPLPEFVPDTVFSVLEVDEMVERYAESAAPAYPPDLLAMGSEGTVQTRYVVDTSGMVDTSSIEVLFSDDARFTESVRHALGLARFRPARRAGQAVRQMVEQQFSFRIRPPPGTTHPVS
jgi:TonB family protein